MFLVKADTESHVIKKGKDWLPQNMRDYITKRDNVFDKHEVVVDPVGKLGTHRTSHTTTIGQHYANNGWYGFERDGWYLLVPADKVKYG